MKQIFIISIILLFGNSLFSQKANITQQIATEKVVKDYNKAFIDLSKGNGSAIALNKLNRYIIEGFANPTWDDLVTGYDISFTKYFNILIKSKGKYDISFEEISKRQDFLSYYTKSRDEDGKIKFNQFIVVPTKKIVNNKRKPGYIIVRSSTNRIVNYWRELPKWANIKGKTNLVSKEELIPYREGDKWGYCNSRKEIIIPTLYGYAEPFVDGFAIVHKYKRNRYDDDKEWLIDKYGNELTSEQFYSVNSFSEGLAKVSKEVGNDFKYGFVDKSGNIAIPIEFERVVSFSEGLALVYMDNEFGYINKFGEIVVPFDFYFNAYSFSDGLAHVCKKVGENYNWEYINKQGQVVIPSFDEMLILSEGLVAVKKEDKWGFVDVNGMLKVPFKFDDARNFSDGIALVKKDNKWIFINTYGKKIFSSSYNQCDAFSEGLAAVEKDKKWGFINKKGKIVIPFSFDNVNHFVEGLAAVKKNGKWGFINYSGITTIPFLFDNLGSAEFFNGICIVEKNGKSGYIDKNGTEYWED